MSFSHSHLLDWAHPLIQEWFSHRFSAPTLPQQHGWPPQLAGDSTLISAPTGSGKTLAAFLPAIDQLVRKSLAGELAAGMVVVYVSPLKALGNDMQKNLLKPLAEIAELAKARQLDLSDIRVAVRTGDTVAKERLAMLKKPPHILLTTPESLYLLLTAEKSRALLSGITTVIVDEIHAMANDKRGAHLALSLERLQALCPQPVQRIGLSATQKPIEQVARFLVGSQRSMPAIINIGHQRILDLAIVAPAELGAVATHPMWDTLYDQLAQLIQQHRSTLIFVNTRRLAERVAHRLAERLGADQVAAHHGSLSPKIRLAAETRLKNGELQALAATASLELGIDIGAVDLVCQIGSTRAIALALQRIGRAGHSEGLIPKGRFFATTRDELLECAALVRAIRLGELDQLIIPSQPLDILMQQLVATCATGTWQTDELFQLVKGAYPYANLSQETFDKALQLLSEGVAPTHSRHGAYLFHDQVNGLVRARRGGRLTAITSGGAIVDNGLFTVFAEPEKLQVGTLDEDFAVESNRGDIVLLGSHSWRVQRVENKTGRVWVEDARGAPPNVPFWRGEAPGRTTELSYQVADLRQEINNRLMDLSDISNEQQPEVVATLGWLMTDMALDKSAAMQLIHYVLAGRAALGAVPTQRTFIAERFFDESGGMQLVIHAPLGARINKAWALALRKRFCRSFNVELQAQATDDGLNISLTEQHSFPLLDVFRFLHPHSIKDVLIQAILQSPLFTTRWRWVAIRALALRRFQSGRKVQPYLLRMRAEHLLAAVFPDAVACQDNLGGRELEPPDHPLIEAALQEILTEALDLQGLIEVLQQIHRGDIHCLAVDSPTPSVFAHEILQANPYAFLDDAPLEERRTRAVMMRQVLPSALLAQEGRLDSEAIAETIQSAFPDIRDADELHDLLQTLIVLPTDWADVGRKWPDFFNELVVAKRALVAQYQGRIFWVAVEKMATLAMLYPDATHSITATAQFIPTVPVEEALATMVSYWLQLLGPTTATALQQLLAMAEAKITTALLKLESRGSVLRGHFQIGEELQWCDRRLLARIQRLTLDRLRQQIKPVTAEEFMGWLQTWQHQTPASRLKGEHGLLQVIRQLQGFAQPAKSWGTIFAQRVIDYDSTMLDRLCLSGHVGWGRLSLHDTLTADSVVARRITPRRTVPIGFFVRGECDWLDLSHLKTLPVSFMALSTIAQNIYHHLQQKGASFMVDIIRAVYPLATGVEQALLELVAAGLVTADGFHNLHHLLHPKPQAHKNRFRSPQPLYSSGRWALLQACSVEPQARVEAACRLLMARYGVVFRELLAQETYLPPWRELRPCFQQLEARGEIRGGLFVSGFFGEQFALPSVVESLRIHRKKDSEVMVG